MTTGVRNGWLGNSSGSFYRHTMEIKQITACLLAKLKAEIRTSQAKVNANVKEMKEDMTARLEAMVQNNQEGTETNQKKR
jgi:hypothetical protein